MKFFALLFAMILPSLSMACPLGPKDDRLNIHQVMINFGRYTLKADMLALRGTNHNEQINDAEIQQAAADLKVAISCTDAVLNGHTSNPDLLPDKADFLEGKERAEYIDDFLYFMSDFKDLLNEYHNTFTALLSQPPETRNWKAVYAKDLELRDFAAHAHGKL